MSEYEEQRLQRIRQNRELLISLGIASELEGLSNLSRDDNEDSNSAKDAKRRRTSTAVEAAPTRTLRSRVKTGSVKENSFRELKEKRVKPKKKPTSPLRPYQGRSLEERMSELEVGTLVDLSTEEAVFIVLGSTRKPYKVLISGSRTKCACLDYRLRKRECKHIALLRKTLGLTSDSLEGWHAAVLALLDQQS
mmetsp:Transcript_16084/g.36780  ORF Transcript_16084/g.36780 Transcript_16084/m.36780 type:complete len:193 (+) Transcript_16084:121-699(+)